MKIKNIACFYYGDDSLDGVASAWVVRTHNRQLKLGEAKLYPVNHYNPPPCLPTGILYMVGFVYRDIEVMRRLIDTASKVIVIDHHSQAQDVIDQLSMEYPSHRFMGITDTGRSSCGLCWDVLINVARPDMINYIEDQETRQYHYPQTRLFCDGLRRDPITLDRLHKCLMPDQLKRIIERGHKTSEYIQDVWEGHLKEIHDAGNEVPYLTLSGIKIPMITLETPALRADISQRFLSFFECPVVGVLWKVGCNTRVRLLSAQDGPNVNTIARSFGGQGNPHCAEFTLEATLPDELIA